MNPARLGKTTAALLALALLAGCSGDRPTDAPAIVTTTADVQQIARELAGNAAQVQVLCPAAANPLLFRPAEKDLAALRRARMWIRLGGGVEAPWEGAALDAAANAALRAGGSGYLNATESLLPLDAAPTPSDAAASAVGCLLDPVHGRAIARRIAARLAEVLPGGETLRENLGHLLSETDLGIFGYGLIEAHGAERLWALQSSGQLASFFADKSLPLHDRRPLDFLASLRGRKVAACSAVWAAFARRWELDLAVCVQPDPARPPSESEIAAAVARMRELRVTVLLAEPWADRATVERIAQQASAVAVFCPAARAGDPCASSYRRTIEYVLNLTASALRGE